jgi:hypothetical protein
MFLDISRRSIQSRMPNPMSPASERPHITFNLIANCQSLESFVRCPSFRSYAKIDAFMARVLTARYNYFCSEISPPEAPAFATHRNGGGFTMAPCPNPDRTQANDFSPR